MQYLVEGGSNDDFHASPRRAGPSRSTRHVPAHRRHRPDFQARAANATVRSGPVENVIITGSVSDEDAKKLFPQAWKASMPDLRITTQPR